MNKSSQLFPETAHGGSCCHFFCILIWRMSYNFDRPKFQCIKKNCLRELTT